MRVHLHFVLVAGAVAQRYDAVGGEAHGHLELIGILHVQEAASGAPFAGQSLNLLYDGAPIKGP